MKKTHQTKGNIRGRLADGTPNPIDLHVGKRVNLRRTMMGMSQERLASELGITFQQVQKYEKGLNRIGASRLWDLAQVLGVNVPVITVQEDCPQTNCRMTTLNFLILTHGSEKMWSHWSKLTQKSRTKMLL